MYSIDKILFLQIYQKARQNAISEKNIRSAWSKSGLFPFNPELVIQELSSVRHAKQLAQEKAQARVVEPDRLVIRGNLTELPLIITPLDISGIQVLLARTKEMEARVAIEATRVRALEDQVVALNSRLKLAEFRV